MREAAGNGRVWRGRTARTWKHYALSPDPGSRVDLDTLRDSPSSGRQGTFPTAGSPSSATTTAELLAEPALLDDVGQDLELGRAQGPHEPGAGARVLHGGVAPSTRRPTQRDCRQTKIRMGTRTLFAWRA